MKTTIRILTAAILSLAPLICSGANAYFRVPAGAFPPPSSDSKVHSVLPDNSGRCAAIWDDSTTASTLIELRGTNGAQVWAHALTGLGEGELSRLALAGPGRLLWASASHWVILDWETGQTLTNGTWNYPDLDSRKVLIRGNSLLIQQGIYTTIAMTSAPPATVEGSAEGKESSEEVTGSILDPEAGMGPAVTYSRVCTGSTFTEYDTNLNVVATYTTALPEGQWEFVEGNWLIDRADKTNACLRFATLDDALQAVNIHEVPLDSGRGGGFVSHLPIGAGAQNLVVISTVEWTPRTYTALTMVDRDGAVMWQNGWLGSEHLTGCTQVTNGWLLSGINFAQAQGNCQYLLFLDLCGWFDARQHYYASPKWEFMLLNTQPPRLLHQDWDNRVELFDLRVQNTDPWWSWWEAWNTPWVGPPFVAPTHTTYWRTRTSPPWTDPLL